jgi:hypothetical protein
MVENESEERSLVVRDSGAMATPMPTVSPAEARDAMAKYLALCDSVLTNDDYQSFMERGKTKRFKKKSAVKKLQTFFSVSVSVRDVARDDLGEGHFGFRCVAVATTPGGRSVEATGGCSTYEERFDLKRFDDESDARYLERCKKARARSYHDVLSTAETRATNRAVMNCIGVGGGEVTADEISRSASRPETQTVAPAKVVEPGEKQRKYAMVLCKRLNLTDDERHEFFEQICGYDASGEPIRTWAAVNAAGKASRVIDALKSEVDKLVDAGILEAS